MSRTIKLLIFTLLTINTAFTFAGEPVTGAEIYVAQDPNIAPVANAVTYVNYIDINLHRVAQALRDVKNFKIARDLDIVAEKMRNIKHRYALRNLKSANFRRLPEYMGRRKVTIAPFLKAEPNNIKRAISMILRANPRSKVAHLLIKDLGTVVNGLIKINKTYTFKRTIHPRKI